MRTMNFIGNNTQSTIQYMYAPRLSVRVLRAALGRQRNCEAGRRLMRVTGSNAPERETSRTLVI